MSRALLWCLKRRARRCDADLPYGAGIGATPPRAASAGVFEQVTIGGLTVGREVLVLPRRAEELR